MAPWSSAPCGQRTLAPTAVAPGRAVRLRRSSYASQVSVPPPQWVSRPHGGRDWLRGPTPGHRMKQGPGVSAGPGMLVAGTVDSGWAEGEVLFLMTLISPHPHPRPHGPPFRPPASAHSSPLASPGLMTGGDTAVLPAAEPGHFPQTRDPAQGHSPRDPSRGRDAEGLGAASSSHPRPTTW